MFRTASLLLASYTVSLLLLFLFLFRFVHKLMGLVWNVLLLVAILTYALHFVYKETLATAATKTTHASSMSYQALTVPLVFLSCTNPMKFSDLYVETAPCIGSHSSSDSSVSTVYSYFMLGGRLDEGYPADFIETI
ncbi:hypothetical protein M0R45_015811 [Rubus argutus]|uniref:Uncharacterized protein n=1 Tax=Rubus argutus TaxID=59490 RepID=A0AAW1XQS7_RUBAR